MDVSGGLVEAAAPVVGWRYWQVSKQRRLRSVTQKWIEWAPGHPLKAVCLELHHPAPADGCNCGVYASRDLEILREHGLCLVPGVPIVVGQVALWGRVVTDDQSLRGELGAPVSLSLVTDTVEDGLLDETLAALGAYEVPVDAILLDEAVAGASAAMLRFQAMSLEASRRFS